MNIQTAADLEALNRLQVMTVARERSCRQPKYLEDRTVFMPGDRVVWLWHPFDGLIPPTPIRAIVLQANKTQARVRAEFVTGPVVLWVGFGRLRPVKKGG